MEISENTTAQTSKEKKKRKKPVFLIILAALLLVILGVVLFVYIKLSGMNDGKVKTIPMPSNLPSVTAEPAEVTEETPAA